EDVDDEEPGVEEVRMGLRLLVDADDEQRRLEGERGDGICREPVRLSLRVARGEDGDPGGEQSHHAPQLLRIEHRDFRVVRRGPRSETLERGGPSTHPSPSGSRSQPPAAWVPPSTGRVTPVT